MSHSILQRLPYFGPSSVKSIDRDDEIVLSTADLAEKAQLDVEIDEAAEQRDEQLFDERMRLVEAKYQRQIESEREHCQREVSEHVGTLIRDRLHSLELSISGTLAAIVAPFIGALGTRKLISECESAVRRAIADRKGVRVSIAGPQWIADEIRLAFERGGIECELQPSDQSDLMIDVDPAVIRLKFDALNDILKTIVNEQ